MSLNIITVTLNMDTVNFLGISIVGQSNNGGDGGIYVGSIMKGFVLCILTLLLIDNCFISEFCLKTLNTTCNYKFHFDFFLK